MEPRELFTKLESNNAQIVEDVKKQFHDYFNQSKESWLVNILVEYYVSSESVRSVEIIVGVREPHDKFLFEKLLELLRNVPNSRLRALTLLGDVVKKQPTWLHKISQHSLFKELLKILKTETDILILMSALLTLIVLLPMIPAYVGPFLLEIFEVFSRLASWNTINPSKLPEDQLIHLQVSLHELFHRLYGMYPCNFVAYLQTEYSIRENLGIFSHTIKPMLETVRMHPLLVTASKDVETATYRWKSMEHHDVVVECAKFAVEIRDDGNMACASSSSARSSINPEMLRVPESNSRLPDINLGFDLDAVGNASQNNRVPTPPLQPLLPMQPPQETTAPTSIPVTSYVLSTSFPHQEGTSPPEAAIEATPETTPVKDMRQYTRVPVVNSNVVRALNNFSTPKWNSTCTTPTQSQPSSPMKKENSPFGFPDNVEEKKKESVSSIKINKILQDRLNQEPSSPLKIFEPNSASSPGSLCAKNGFRFDDVNEDCDGSHEVPKKSRGDINELNEECEQEIGSPCTTGGLHMPNSRSVIDFHKGVNRMRHLSYSATTSDISHIEMSQVRKSCSCPEIEKDRPSLSSYDANDSRFNETDEDSDGMVNGDAQLCWTSVSTQTMEPLMCYPYGHMFLSVFPNADTTTEKFDRFSPVTLLDKYIEIASVLYTEEGQNKKAGLEHELKELKEQLNLVHLQLKFERHRREVHAERNRRLLGKSRNNRYLEEHNAALRDQLALVEHDIERLNFEISKDKADLRTQEMKLEESVKHWQDKFTILEKKNRELKTENEELVSELQQRKQLHATATKDFQLVEAKLFEVGNEMKHVLAQANAGEELKAQVQYLQKELILVGELQQRYRDKLIAMSAQREQASLFTQECYVEEVRVMNGLLESKTSSLEAMKIRIAELESLLTRKDMLVAEQKRSLKVVKEECQEQLKALEDKYEAQRAINKKLEERTLELNNKLEANIKRNKRCVSTAQDVLSLAERGGLNSPLSLSLSSSEGVSMSGVISDSLQMRDLRSIIDEPDKITKELDEYDSPPPGPSNDLI